MPGLILLAMIVALALAAVVAGARAILRTVALRLEVAGSEVRRLADVGTAGERDARETHVEVSAVRAALEGLRVRDEERRMREEEAWSTLQRLSSVLAGSQAAGQAGERVLHEVLGSLPPSMLERDFRVNGRVVEFALRLSDGRRLPIDSKWPAVKELAVLDDGANAHDRQEAALAVERIVARRVREVSGYRDPALTAPLAVAAVPDAAYAVLRRAHVEAYRQGVVVVPYSTALPILLALSTLAARMGEVGDVRACLADLGAVLDAIESTLENKLERASVMLANGAGELRGHLGRARASVTRAIEPTRAPEEVGPHLVEPP